MTSLSRRFREIEHPGSLLALVGVAALFGLGQFLTMDMSRFFAWDEAVYLSQASPHIVAMGPGPHRARGITWIVSPIALLTESIPLIRAYLASISTLALFGSFVVWRPLFHWVSPLGAGLFGSSWLALGYGSELMPNLWSAFAAVAATGFIVLSLSRSDLKWQVAAGISAMVLTVVRPLDGAIVLCVTLVAVVINRGDQGRVLGLLVMCGSLVGITPWLIEAWLRFEGPISRLATTRELVGSGVTNNLSEYLRFLAAPLDSGRLATDPSLMLYWIAGLLLVSTIALAWATSPHVRRGAWVSFGSSVLLAAPYLFYTTAAAPRFMTPALAMLSLSAALGLWTLTSHTWLPRTVSFGILMFVVVVTTTLHTTTVLRWSQFQTEIRGTFQQLAHELNTASQGRPCALLATYGYPQLAVGSGCIGHGLADDRHSNLDFIEEQLDEGRAVFALVASHQPNESIDPTWRCMKLDISTRWHLCAPPS